MISAKRIFILLYLGVFVQIVLTGQVVTLETKVDTHKIELGDRVELTYILEKSIDAHVLLPELKDTLILGVEILGIPQIDTINLKNDKIRIEQKLTLTSFDEGKHFIPEQKFLIKTEDGFDTILSKASYFEVLGVAIDTTGTIRDIAGLEKAPIIFRDFLPLFILLGLVLVALLIAYLIRRYKKQKGLLPIQDKPKEPAHIIALRELDKLKAQKLWQQQQEKEYYSRLTNIIRTYIEDRFNILAMEKPSSEVLAEIKLLGIEKKVNLTEFERLLNLADLVKFAKGSAQSDENIEHLENAYKLVKTTYKVDEEDLENEKTKNEE